MNSDDVKIDALRKLTLRLIERGQEPLVAAWRAFEARLPSAATDALVYVDARQAPVFSAYWGAREEMIQQFNLEAQELLQTPASQAEPRPTGPAAWIVILFEGAEWPVVARIYRPGDGDPKLGLDVDAYRWTKGGSA